MEKSGSLNSKVGKAFMSPVAPSRALAASISALTSAWSSLPAEASLEYSLILPTKRA